MHTGRVGFKCVTKEIVTQGPLGVGGVVGYRTRMDLLFSSRVYTNRLWRKIQRYFNLKSRRENYQVSRTSKTLKKDTQTSLQMNTFNAFVTCLKV